MEKHLLHIQVFVTDTLGDKIKILILSWALHTFNLNVIICYTYPISILSLSSYPALSCATS